MKTNCRECKGKGTVHIDIPGALDRTFDLKCWICVGTNFEGMTPEQVKWYQEQYKTLEKLKTSIMKTGEVKEPVVYQTLKGIINKACSLLGIQLQPIHYEKSTQFGISSESLRLRAEVKEYYRRLTQIPLVMNKRSVLRAA